MNILNTAKKIFCIEYKGRKCTVCGLDLVERPWSAHFHHRNKKKKLFGISVYLSSGFELFQIKDELDKCDLYCGNCHADEHFNLEEFNRQRSKIHELKSKLSFESTHITEQNIEQAKRLADEGFTLKEISDKLGFCTITIRKYLVTEKFGNDRRRKITDDELQLEYKQGFTLRDIATKYGMGYKTVWKRWRKINGLSKKEI